MGDKMNRGYDDEIDFSYHSFKDAETWILERQNWIDYIVYDLFTDQLKDYKIDKRRYILTQGY